MMMYFNYSFLFFFSYYKTVILGWFQGAATSLITEAFCNLKYASLTLKKKLLARISLALIFEIEESIGTRFHWFPKR